MESSLKKAIFVVCHIKRKQNISFAIQICHIERKRNISRDNASC